MRKGGDCSKNMEQSFLFLNLAFAMKNVLKSRDFGMRYGMNCINVAIITNVEKTSTIHKIATLINGK